MVSSVTLRAAVNWKSNALANQVNLDMLVCLKITDLLYMTCNIQFVFVKRWSIFCNYRTVFELQQYPMGPNNCSSFSHQKSRKYLVFLLGLNRIRRIRATSHVLSKRVFWG